MVSDWEFENIEIGDKISFMSRVTTKEPAALIEREVIAFNTQTNTNTMLGEVTVIFSQRINVTVKLTPERATYIYARDIVSISKE